MAAHRRLRGPRDGKDEDGKTIRQSLKDGGLSLIKTVLVPSLMAFITAFFIQPWAARYWQHPNLDVLGVLPIHFYEEEQDPFPGKTPPDKMYHHRLGPFW
jgi:hypothetical protein